MIGNEQPGQPAQAEMPAPAPSGAPWNEAESRAVHERYAALRDGAPDTVEYELAGSGSRQRGAFMTGLAQTLDVAAGWFRRHWLAVLNGALATYIGVAVLTPIAYMFGASGPASAVFRTYRFFCDQLPTHSFFIGGYQICICQRCLAIYTTMLLGGLLLAYLRTRRPVRALGFWLWALAALPMALDGGTQLFGWRESNPGLRLLTGALFGLATVWLTFPRMNEAAQPDPEPQPAYARAGS
jgi:uncharacterized membrane protein